MVTFREAKSKDYETFNSLWANVQYLGGVANVRNESMSKESFDKHVEDESIIIAEVDETAIGYAIVNAYEDGEVVIREIFINDANRHKGFGRKMVRYIENTAKMLEMSKVTLDSATMETDRFWEHLGYSSRDKTDEYFKML